MNNIFTFTTGNKGSFLFKESNVSDNERPSVHTTVYNFTSEPILVIHRSGVRYVLKREFGGNLACPKETVVIKNHYRFHVSFMSDLSDFFRRKEVLGNMTPDLRLLYERFLSESSRLEKERSNLFAMNNSKFCASDIELEISSYIYDKELKENKFMYINDVDIVVTHDVENKVLEHPFSNIGLSQDRYILNSRLAYKFGVMIDIVDNFQLSSAYYMFVAGGVREIRSMRNDTRIDGVYISEVYQDADGEQKLREVGYAKLEEAGEIYGIYTNRIDAESFGNRKLYLENQISNSKLVSLEKDSQLKDQLREIEIQKEELNLSRARYNEELERNRNKLEIEKTERAVETEKVLQKLKLRETIIKTLSGIIITGAALLTAIIKFKKVSFYPT